MPPIRRSWLEKFRNAFRGLAIGLRGQSSFAVHLVAAAGVVGAGVLFGLDRGEWCAIVLAIILILTAEMFNTAIECAARAITGEADPHVRNALDIAAGAVLIASFGAVAIGLIVFGRRLGVLLGWW
jgi:diacylglycerol kinase